MKLTDLLNSSVSIIFPSSCPICWSCPLQYPNLICNSCTNSIKKEIALIFRNTPTINQVLSCSEYNKHIKETIKLFKYNQKRVLPLFDPLIKKALKLKPCHFKDIDIIIPVPLHKKKSRLRGFNQSELIAERLSGFSSIMHMPENLIKIKNTISQTGLSRIERMKNLENSFIIKNPKIVKEKTVLLIDDIVTTGATLETCAKELINAGVKKVKGFTLSYTKQQLTT